MLGMPGCRKGPANCQRRGKFTHSVGSGPFVTEAAEGGGEPVHKFWGTGGFLEAAADEWQPGAEVSD